MFSYVLIILSANKTFHRAFNFMSIEVKTKELWKAFFLRLLYNDESNSELDLKGPLRMSSKF